MAVSTGTPKPLVLGVATYRLPAKGPLMFQIQQGTREVTVTASSSIEAATKVGATGTVGIDFQVVSIGGEVSTEKSVSRGKSIATSWKVILPGPNLKITQL